MKFLKCLSVFIVCFLWTGLALAGRYSDSSREYSANNYNSGQFYSYSRWVEERERKEEEKKKNIIKYTTLGLIGAAYVGYRVKSSDRSDDK